MKRNKGLKGKRSNKVKSLKKRRKNLIKFILEHKDELSASAVLAIYGASEVLKKRYETEETLNKVTASYKAYRKRVVTSKS